MKMSKMKMPEMKAVRFEESDVICASRDYLYMQGWSDSTKLNGTARTDYDGDILAANINNTLNSYFGGNVTFYPADQRPYALATMENVDSDGDAINDFDGYYRYNSERSVWERVTHQ